MLGLVSELVSKLTILVLFVIHFLFNTLPDPILSYFFCFETQPGGIFYHYSLGTSIIMVYCEIGRIACIFFVVAYFSFFTSSCSGYLVLFHASSLVKKFYLCNYFFNLLALLLVHICELMAQFNHGFIGCFHFMDMLLIHPQHVAQFLEDVTDNIFGDDVILPHISCTFK